MKRRLFKLGLLLLIAFVTSSYVTWRGYRELVPRNYPDSNSIAFLFAYDLGEVSSAVPLGVREFVLQGVGSILPGFDPSSWVGHKVQVKGVLRRRSGRELLNTLSLESVASSCP